MKLPEVENRFCVTDEASAIQLPPVVQSCFVPQHYEPNYAYPLIVWLHADGSSDRELWDVMPKISLRNYAAVAPRGLARGDGRGFSWDQTAEAVLHADHAIGESVERASRRFHIAPHRIFLAGAGSGGTMALRVGLLNPHRFAGVLSIGGSLPRGQSPLRHLTQLRQLRVWMAFRTDGHAPIDDVCHDLRLLHSAGVHVMLRQYAGRETATPRMFSDMNKWVMERVTGHVESQDSVPTSPYSDSN